ncbi:MAG: MBL fold metallo-hydrolase [Acidobacteriota bacterium]|nr:MBL fold metallo-hydrolase [Acidobacteriota bacterium]
MNVEFRETGIYLPEIDLWLDNIEPCGATWISHGHSDHARGCHGRVIGTATTLNFYRMRLWLGEAQDEPELIPLEFGEAMEWNGAKLSAFPASHILGAAQFLIEHRGERLVYTGDIKLRPPLCGETTKAVPCDRLIIESTFGLPIYRLLSREQAIERIVTFAHGCLAEGITPSFIGYALGRGQEIVHVLCEAGICTAVHGAIAKFIPAYEAQGYNFRGWEPYDAKSIAGKALVVVPSHGSALEASGKKVRLAYVSGWAALDNARARSGAEELIPYSDHADFDELLRLVEQSAAKQIDVVHGYTVPFSRILRQRGYSAAAPHRAGARTTIEAEG